MTGEWEKPIIRRVLAGDPDAFADIVEHYGRPIYNLMYRMTGDRDDARELAQEAFARTFEQLGRYDGKRRFFPWLYTVALNIARNHRKKTALRCREALTEIVSEQPSPDPERAIQNRYTEQRLQSCIARLQPHEKEAVVLRYFQDLSFEEIAGILEISCSAAKMRVYRALKRLRSALEEWEDHG